MDETEEVTIIYHFSTTAPSTSFQNQILKAELSQVRLNGQSERIEYATETIQN